MHHLSKEPRVSGNDNHKGINVYYMICRILESKTDSLWGQDSLKVACNSNPGKNVESQCAKSTVEE